MIQYPIYNKILDLIFSNKEMPHYSAERRLDVIFGVFIEDILSTYFHSPIKLITSEFPLKQRQNNAANVVDYLCRDEQKNEIIYVELKTDPNSYDVKQLGIYRTNLNWPKVVSNLRKKIVSPNLNSGDRIKYSKLLSRLNSFGIISGIFIHLINRWRPFNQFKKKLIQWFNEL